jgi:1-acyl-sn-glycerol-3-phosphate acyltransferase
MTRKKRSATTGSRTAKKPPRAPRPPQRSTPASTATHAPAGPSRRAAAAAPAEAAAPESAPTEADRSNGAHDEGEASADVASRIRELEHRLDRMIVDRVRERESQHDLEDGLPPRRSTIPPPRPSQPAAHVPPAPVSERFVESARELLTTDFYLRKWGRMGLRNRSEEVDEFGYDPVYEQRVLPFFDLLYSKYFRVEVHGADRIPAEGRCVLVANHSGTLPFDGMMLRLAVRREHPNHREVRWLAEDVIFHFPFLGSFSNRLGAVRACPENAERLLDQESLLAVFPEGLKGIGKLFKDRYKLQRFGRGGFIKLCLRTRTPVVPVAILGGEETNPMLARLEGVARAIGIPYLPVTPTFPLLGPMGLVPAPTKWKIFFGEPIDLRGHGAESADDEILVGRLTEQVRGAIQAMLDHAVAQRRSVWFG